MDINVQVHVNWRYVDLCVVYRLNVELGFIAVWQEDEEEKMESPVPQPHCSSYPSENGHCDQTTTGTSGEPPTENVEGW